MSGPSRTIAVVVPAYNEEQSIAGTLAALYDQDYTDGAMHVVVDNGSTDATRQSIKMFSTEHPEFPLVVLDEEQKGTGSASDTGFRYAIEQGYPIIARTDADTLPEPAWTSAILAKFALHDELRLLGGPKSPRKDDGWYKSRDRLLWSAGMAFAGLIAKSRVRPVMIAGCNMATDAGTYIEVGGFPRTAIDTTDEDQVYEERVLSAYGPEAIAMSPDMKVRTSMRRVRSIGYVGLARARFAQDTMTRKSLMSIMDVR